MYELKRKLKLTEEQEALVRDKILALPQQERIMIYLYFWEQYSHRQIARDLCVPVEVIPKIIQRAMNRIRGELFEMAGIYFETYALKKRNNYYGV